MLKLELIYTNLKFNTMIDFHIKSKLTYDIAYEKYAVTEYISCLLRDAKEVIKQFGDTVELSNQFARHMCDAELDYLLLPLEQDVDAMIDDQSLKFCLPTFTETNENFVIHR